MASTSTGSAKSVLEMETDEVLELFEKEYKLPHVDALSRKSYGNLDFTERLQEIKIELNARKGQTGAYPLEEWSKHTKRHDLTESLIARLKTIEPEMLTQAWCKFYELLSRYDIIPPSCRDNLVFNSVHLCEAPGAFVTSLNHYLKTFYPYMQLNHLASSLNPYHEGNDLSAMINDDRFILNDLENWYFGEDLTGNIMSIENHENLVQQAKKLFPVYLVTADGSVNCMNDPGNQELTVEHLIFCEIFTALRILCAGGVLVFKMFTMFEMGSICHLYLICRAFTEVILVKPSTSKGGNSEMYVVCLNYLGLKSFSSNLFVDLKDQYINPQASFYSYIYTRIPPEFLQHIEAAAKQFSKKQEHVIAENLLCYGLYSDPEEARLERMKQIFVKVFFEKYTVQSILPDDFIVKPSLYTSYFSFHHTNNSYRCNAVYLCNEMCKKLEINVRCGKKCTIVKNSKFIKTLKTSDWMSVLENHFFNEKATANLQEVVEGDTITLYFDEVYRTNKNIPGSERTIYKRMQEVIGRNQFKNIGLIGFLPITFFSVGILYVLHFYFESVLFQSDGKIFFKNLKPRTTLNIFEEIAKIFETYKVSYKCKNKCKQTVPDNCTCHACSIDIVTFTNPDHVVLSNLFPLVRDYNFRVFSSALQSTCN